MGTNELSSPSSPVHAIIFPFMSKGHTVPLLHFARILLHRHLAVTVFTTPANRPFVSQMVQDTAAAVIDLPFPHGIADIPAGVESTDKLPSISLFHAFASATSLMKPHFEHALRSLPRVTFMVSDAFLWWTLDSASKFGFHRFVFYGMSNYCHALYQEVIQSGFLGGPQPLDELVTLTRFPWIRVSKNDFDLSFRSQDHMFFNKVRLTAFNSYGRIVNSFYELEPDFADFVNREMSLKSWSVGPLCLAAKLGPIRKTELESNQIKKPVWVKWLDQKLEEKSSVLYVAFGSQVEISCEQLKEIAIGLEKSKVNFLWVMGKDVSELPDKFEERMKGRGMVVREWVDQWEILMHENVEGFVSHCGWNSVMESICAGVPILAWPMMADQHLNAKMVEEEMKVGFKVKTCECLVRGFVNWEVITKTVRELMEGEKGKEVRKKVRELAKTAKKAVQENGSSWFELNSLLHQTCKPIQDNNGMEI